MSTHTKNKAQEEPFEYLSSLMLHWRLRIGNPESKSYIFPTMRVSAADLKQPFAVWPIEALMGADANNPRHWDIIGTIGGSDDFAGKIVTAFKCHDDFVDVVQRLITWHENPDAADDVWSDARAALAKAGVKS